MNEGRYIRANSLPLHKLRYAWKLFKVDKQPTQIGYIIHMAETFLVFDIYILKFFLYIINL